MSHTIILLQPKGVDTRTFYDFDNLNDAVKYLISMFELHLKQDNPGVETLKYELPQLFDYFDKFTDISALVFQRTTSTYSPFPKNWIQEKMYLVFNSNTDSSEK